ncbi:hypothetical protein [Chitinophaga solisilvae]|uniref:hypothetical protein n=1 Tax=Chitinophaga solisilvae TaxID=1233460 RepID=UPI001371BD8D|nr:hypothetical protein [Chitinophaga solisilvae]
MEDAGIFIEWRANHQYFLKRPVFFWHLLCPLGAAIAGQNFLHQLHPVLQNRNYHNFDQIINFFMDEFKTTIDFLKKNALASSILLSDSQIASKIGLGIEKFNEYYHKDTAPVSTLKKLRDSYPQYLIGQTYFTVTYIQEVDPEDPPTPPLTEEEKKNGKFSN